MPAALIHPRNVLRDTVMGDYLSDPVIGGYPKALAGGRTFYPSLFSWQPVQSLDAGFTISISEWHPMHWM